MSLIKSENCWAIGVVISLLITFLMGFSISKVYSQVQLEGLEIQLIELDDAESFVSADGEPEPIKPTPIKGGPNLIPAEANFDSACNKDNLGIVFEQEVIVPGLGAQKKQIICCLKKLEILTDKNGVTYIPAQSIKFQAFAGTTCCPVGYYVSPPDLEKIEYANIQNLDDSCSRKGDEGKCQFCDGVNCVYPQPDTQTGDGKAHVNLLERPSIWPQQRLYIEKFYNFTREEINKKKDGPILCSETEKIFDCYKDKSVDDRYKGLGSWYCNHNCFYGGIIDKLNHPGCTYNLANYAIDNKDKLFDPTLQIKKDGLTLLCSRPGHIDAKDCNELAVLLNEPRNKETTTEVTCETVKLDDGASCEEPDTIDLKKLRVELGNGICCECTGGRPKE